MKWNILNNLKAESKELKVEEIVKLLLNDRGLKTKKQVEEFLNPKHPEKFSVRDLGIDKGEIQKAIKRIKKAIKNDESIIVYGDYDADGICATAILWETLYKLTKNVLPYIPERVSEGYGLNENSIKNLKLKIKNLKLMITVDHGITAAEKIKYAKGLGIDVIVCDHHQLGKIKPKCTATIHTDKICAAAISWFLANAVDRRPKSVDYLDLVAIATIADLEPLVGVNRSFVKYGLKALNKSERLGLQAIFKEAGLKQGEIGTYEVGFIIAPRLNAMGRVDHALESLRLLCTGKAEKADELALRLGLTNKERQLMLEKSAKHAIESSRLGSKNSKLLFICHESYNQGIIGLVAGKLVEEFYRPAIVVSLGEQYSKASARSISGFNIIEAIREQSSLLVDVGGHPMAAGFTIETAKIEILKEKLQEAAEKQIPPEMLEKALKIDMGLPLSLISLALCEEIKTMSPFGLGNPEPVFASKVKLKDFRLVGADGKHLKLTVAEGQKSFGAIAFSQGYRFASLKFDQEAELAYSLSLNEWNDEKRIELKVRDIK